MISHLRNVRKEKEIDEKRANRETEAEGPEVIGKRRRIQQSRVTLAISGKQQNREEEPTDIQWSPDGQTKRF